MVAAHPRFDGGEQGGLVLYSGAASPYWAKHSADVTSLDERQGLPRQQSFGAARLRTQTVHSCAGLMQRAAAAPGVPDKTMIELGFLCWHRLCVAL